VLICGFEPFGEHLVNISEQVAESMDDIRIGDCEVEAQILTVDESGSQGVAKRLENGERFACILLLGLAENSEVPRIEILARDLLDFKIADNSGRQPTAQEISGEGDLPSVSNAMQWPCHALHLAPVISTDAGGFLCNELYYRTLQAIDDATPCIFLHLPAAKNCPNPQLLARQCIEKMLEEGPTDVVAAAIIDDGSFLVTRRSPSQKHAGMWEFPGGKCERGETMAECLCREILEELSLMIEVGESIGVWIPQLEGQNIRLHVHLCNPLSSTIELSVHDKMLWCQRREDLVWLGPNGDIADKVTLVLDAK
jgi:8-oxo-dGTP diphosphatase